MTNPVLWNVTVTFQGLELTEADAERILGGLASHRPVLVLAEVVDGSYRYAMTVHVEETTVRKAIASGLRLVEGARIAPALAVEAQRQDDLVRQLERTTVPQLVGNADIADMLGVTRQRAAQLADVDGFPPAVMTIKAGPLRVRDQVEDWARTWNRKAGRPKKTSVSTS